MRRVAAAAGLMIVVACAGLALGATPADTKPKPLPPGVEHDFGGKVLYVRTSSPKTDLKDGGQFGFTYGYLEQVQVRKLGDRSFLVGEYAVRAGEENPHKGVKLWIPLSVVTELGEFDSMDALDKTLGK